MRDLAVAQRVEAGDVELHHALVEALAEEYAEQGCSPVALDHQTRHLAAQLRIAGAHRLPHAAQFGLAAAMAHMGEEVDRGVGKRLDIVGAARQRALDVARIEYVEE